MKVAALYLSLLLPLRILSQDTTVIRINQLGYWPEGGKVAVLGRISKGQGAMGNRQLTTGNKEGGVKWELREAESGKTVYKGAAPKDFGAYGPFQHSYRLDFSAFRKPGRYYLQAGPARSQVFRIDSDVYKGTADFCLRYMRQQRTGFNPFLKDSCHTHDGYVLYGEKAGIPDSTRIDVVGGWHDASDYLQYSSTSANATYHLLMAWRDFPLVFGDEKQASGLDGKNGRADVLDEAKWGLDWLLKMHPRPDWLFNQIADDRDHMGMRIPGQDTFYGRGFERPVYFVSGEPQQRGKYMNATTGTSSTAGKFASAFALGEQVFRTQDKEYSGLLYQKALSAYTFGLKKKGFTQTASVKSPYIYAEMNWPDDLELAAATLYKSSGDVSHLGEAYAWAQLEKITPWLGKDTAAHYQWYPFINLGHYVLGRQLTGSSQKEIIGYYKKGIDLVWQKARHNAFYRGVPFIWCSNNLTVAFVLQCYWYRQLTGDKTYTALEQANIDWLFGCNPWGTSMVYGLPAHGDTPVDPHSAFTHLGNYPIDGGLIDGPVYGSIYKNLIGIILYQPDEYAAFQSDLAVYHDDYGDYSTNEPTMDGTASLIYLLAAMENQAHSTKKQQGAASAHSFNPKFSFSTGAVTRGDSTRKNIALVFTGHEFGDGGDFIAAALAKEKVKASFFLTGDFYRNASFKKTVQRLQRDGHYLGPHSDKHLLYCDWKKRDSLLVSKKEFLDDLSQNMAEIRSFVPAGRKPAFFLPPYEWYNDSIAAWTREAGFTLINYTPGTLSHADYTIPGEKNYRGSEEIEASIRRLAKNRPGGLNGFILLMHIGSDPRRTDKFYHKLPGLLDWLQSEGYQFQRVDELLRTD